MTTRTFEPTIFETSHPGIVKRVSVTRLLLSISMLILGGLLFLSVFSMSDTSSALSMALMVTGAAFLLSGVFRLFWKSREVFYLPTGSVVKGDSYFFSQKDLAALSQIMENRQFDGQTNLFCESSGNVRLDALFTLDHRFAALQLFQFVPYTYTPVTSIVYFTEDDAKSVSAFLKRCKEHV